MQQHYILTPFLQTTWTMCVFRILNLIILLNCNMKAQVHCFYICLRGASCQSLNETSSKITPQLLLLPPLIFKVGYFQREMVVWNMEQTNRQSWRHGSLRPHPDSHTDAHTSWGKKDEQEGQIFFYVSDFLWQ